MRPTPEIYFDVASALHRGRRDYQEDALAVDFPLGAGVGYAVLSDGMGGHAAGDVASKIVVTEVFSELKFQSGDVAAFEAELPDILQRAAQAANDCMRAHAEDNPETKGMGATLCAPVFLRDRLYWISIGDSPLFLFREGKLEQINEDHSLAPQIDFMVNSGLMAADVGKNHPDRNALTSVLVGDDIVKIDCPTEPTQLADGDVLIVSSDGLQFLDDEVIHDILAAKHGAPSDEIAGALLEALEDLDDPDQDNIALSVIQVHMRARPSEARVRPAAGTATGKTRTEAMREHAWARARERVEAQRQIFIHRRNLTGSEL